MTGPKEQPAVTATLWLERAEHCNPILPTASSPMFSAVAEEMEEYAECKVAAFARVASAAIASAEQSAATPWFAWPARRTWEEVRVRLRSRDGNEWEEIASDFEYWMQSADGEMCDDVVAFQIIGETPLGLASVSSASAEIDALWHKLWMVACHATGGGIPEIEGIERSTNDICVQITAFRNKIYQAGKDATSPEPVPATNQAVKWRERWYGSEPQKGSAIVDERGNLIAYFGGDETTHKATTAAVSAHNASIGTQPATSQEELRKAIRKAAQGHGRAGTANWPGGPYMSMDDAADVYAALASAQVRA